MPTTQTLLVSERADEQPATPQILGSRPAAVADLIRINAGLRPEAACIVSLSGAALTWRQLLRQLEETRSRLCDLGIGPDDRVAIVLPNGPELAVAFLTVAASCACAPLNPLYSVDEFAFYLQDLKARVLIISTGAAFAVEAGQRVGVPVIKLESDGEVPGLFSLSSGSALVVPRPNPILPRFGAADDIALLLHTSGTTSKPKLVPLRHRNLMASAQNMVETLRLSAADRCFNLMPLFHIHGLIGGLLAPLAAGGSAVCPPTFRPGDFFRCLEVTRPTWSTAVPTMHRTLVAEAAGKEAIIARSSLRFLRSSSSSLPPALFDQLTKLFRVPVLEAYSMTEACHQMTCNPPVPGQQKPGTVGLPAGPRVAVMDEAGHLLPRGEIGEVVIQGPSVFSGYEANPEANAKAFVNGWFRTGDQGKFDPDGYLVITGRLKEQINRGGEKISPLEIDNVLLRHPEVMEAVAFGFPHPTLGEEIAAAVVLQPGSGASATSLQTYLRSCLAPFKVPRRITILKEIPKGPTGKLQRRQLGKVLGLDSAEGHRPASIEQEQIAGLELELLDLWRHMLKNESIGIDDDFFDMGGDSLTALQMIIECEQAMGISAPETILFEHPTIRRLSQALKDLDSALIEPMVQVQKGDGVRPPFFFFHGDYMGYGYYTRHLARLVGPDQAFYSIAPHGVDSAPIPPSMEKMAAERLPLILAAQPRGPFRLGGYCNGGMMALEIGQLLTDAGHSVDLIALVDTPILNARPSVRMFQQSIARIMQVGDKVGEVREVKYPRISAILDNSWRQLSNLEQSSLSVYTVNMLGAFRRRVSRLLGKLGPRGGQTSSHSGTERLQQELKARDRRLTGVYNHIFREYVPKKTETPIAYFAAEYSGGRLDCLGTNAEMVPVPGGHWGCVTTHADVLAGHLRRKLDASPFTPDAGKP